VAPRQLAAEWEREPQAGVLADPVLSLGLQSDSFTSYSIGKMKTSWHTVMLTLSFPRPGKRKLRTEVFALQGAVRRREFLMELFVYPPVYLLWRRRGLAPYPAGAPTPHATPSPTCAAGRLFGRI
jgi:hypothetical protein